MKQLLGKTFITIFYDIDVIIQSIGIDIEEIDRFAKNKYRKKESFYNKIFTPQEIRYCLSKTNPYPHFTARFCAKEAAIKALQNKKISFLDIEIKMKKGKPVLELPNRLKGLVSLSHTKKYAIACVIINE